jgi:hypothetical protein
MQHGTTNKRTLVLGLSSSFSTVVRGSPAPRLCFLSSHVARVLTRNRPDPGSKLASRFEDRRIRDRCGNRGRTHDADAGYRLKPPARCTGTMLGVNVSLDITNLLLQSIEQSELGQVCAHRIDQLRAMAHQKVSCPRLAA